MSSGPASLQNGNLSQKTKTRVAIWKECSDNAGMRRARPRVEAEGAQEKVLEAVFNRLVGG